jgi:hypothetical protein
MPEVLCIPEMEICITSITTNMPSGEVSRILPYSSMEIRLSNGGSVSIEVDEQGSPWDPGNHCIVHVEINDVAPAPSVLHPVLFQTESTRVVLPYTMEQLKKMVTESYDHPSSCQSIAVKLAGNSVVLLTWSNQGDSSWDEYSENIQGYLTFQEAGIAAIMQTLN